MRPTFIRLTALTALLALAACRPAASPDSAVTLRLGVALTPEELASFEPSLQAVDQAHQNWQVALQTTPQSGMLEKMNAQLASGTLPDVVRLQGLLAQRWIRQQAFVDLTAYTDNAAFELDDYYAGPLDQFRWNDGLYGMPDTAAPDLVFYNLDMFDASAVPYPDDSWTFEDMRRAAVLLTLDADGRNPTEPGFDPATIQQWGWNGGITNLWQRHLVQPFGGEFCANADCTLMDFTAASTLEAVRWWTSTLQQDFAAPFDPYSGEQTGIPGDPFLAGLAAMGYNGFFAVGQLNGSGSIRYDIAQPFLGNTGERFTPLSTNAYLISATTDHPEEAWELVQALVSPSFLEQTWGAPGHSVPARRSASASALNPERPPQHQAVILQAMEYGQVFLPHTASAFEAHGRTADLFLQLMRGDLLLDSGLEQIEAAANEALASDQSP